jgi:hypothetical protein
METLYTFMRICRAWLDKYLMQRNRYVFKKKFVLDCQIAHIFEKSLTPNMETLYTFMRINI